MYSRSLIVVHLGTSYLNYSFSYSNDTKRSMVYSQFLHLLILCSDDWNFLTQAQNMARCSTLRGYLPNLILTVLTQPWSADRSSSFQYVHAAKQPVPRFLFPKLRQPASTSNRSPSLPARPVRSVHVALLPWSTPPALQKSLHLCDRMFHNLFPVTAAQSASFLCWRSRSRTCLYTANAIFYTGNQYHPFHLTDFLNCTSTNVILFTVILCILAK